MFREIQPKYSRASAHKKSQRPSYEEQLDNVTDIVTISSGSIDTAYHDQQQSSSQKHKDDNCQILSVEGMRAVPLDQQSNTITRGVYENFGNDLKHDDNIEKSALPPASSPGQQVEFYAHL